MTRQRHQILGRSLFDPLPQILRTHRTRIDDFSARLAAYPDMQSSAHCARIESAVSFAVLNHLDFGPIPNLHGEVEAGISHVMEFFDIDWWAGSEAPPEMKKTVFGWTDQLRNGLSLPKLEEKLDAAIVRSETIGLN